MSLIVNFNEDSWLDQDFTNKIDLLREALDRVDSRGGTALYDAVLASADHLKGGRGKRSDTGGHRWRGQFSPTAL